MKDGLQQNIVDLPPERSMPSLTHESRNTYPITDGALGINPGLIVNELTPFPIPETNIPFPVKPEPKVEPEVYPEPTPAPAPAPTPQPQYPRGYNPNYEAIRKIQEREDQWRFRGHFNNYGGPSGGFGGSFHF